VVRRCMWSRNLVNEETLAHWGGVVAPKFTKKKILLSEIFLIPVDTVKHILCKKSKFDSKDFTKAVHCTKFNIHRNTSGRNENMKIVVCVPKSWRNKQKIVFGVTCCDQMCVIKLLS